MIIGHQKQWNFLRSKYEGGTLSHAYLFSGQEQLGKRKFALEFVKHIGCKFPDLNAIEISSIEQVRDVQNFLSYKSYHGGYKAVVVDNAHKMNVSAQSCFLKTLEEPKGQTIIILVSSKPEMLMPTILSRCQTIKFFPVPGLPESAWGRPGRLINFKENPELKSAEEAKIAELVEVAGSCLAEKFQYAKRIKDEEGNIAEILEILQRHFRKLLLSGGDKNYSAKHLHDILNNIEDINQKTCFGNINPKLALETLFLNI